MNYNKKKFLILTLVLLLLFCSERDKITEPSDNNDNYRYTIINGPINGQLTIANSPYLITDELIIDSLSTLQIEPGVILHFSDSANMLIKGSLRAIGTKDDFIQISAQTNIWKGIKFSNSDNNSIFQFVIIENILLSAQDSTEFGAIEINTSSVTLKNCIIRNNQGDNGAGVASINSNILISNCIFRENVGLVFGGGLMLYQSNSTIINNTFYDNFCTNCGAAIALISPANEIIQNNILFNNFSQTGCEQLYFNAQDSLMVLIDYNFISLSSPDPMFFSAEDLKLQTNSPCIDAGNPDPSYNDPDGSRNDQGAFGGPDGDW